MKRIFLRVMLACVCLPLLCHAEDSFYVVSEQSGAKYGPFPLKDATQFKIGQSKFTIRLDRKKGGRTTNTDDTAAKSGNLPDQNKPEVVKAVQAASAAADEWLKLIDSDQYDEAWTNVAGYMSDTVNKAQFLSSLQTIRASLGKVLSRELKSAVYLETMPSAPDGQYVVIQFVTRMENKRQSVETIVPMLNKNGTWAVSGYNIQ